MSNEAKQTLPVRDLSNPFVRDEHGNIRSPAAITRAMRANPEQAVRQCKAAGEPIEVWFGLNPK